MSTKDEKRLVIVTMVTKRLVKSHETPDPARLSTRRSGFCRQMKVSKVKNAEKGKE